METEQRAPLFSGPIVYPAGGGGGWRRVLWGTMVALQVRVASLGFTVSDGVQGLLTAAAFPVCSHLSGSDFQQEVKRRPAVGLLQVAAASRCFLERRRCCQAPGGVPVRWTLPPRRVCATKTVSNKNRRGVSTFSARSGALARSRLRFPACLASTDSFMDGGHRREFRRFQLVDLRFRLICS